jgi:bifunctional non-homologous end joining protein LigD
MALEEYVRKRDFQKTPEPPPGRANPHTQKLGFFVRKHDATRLHYDFRLEMDGVLLSWAVTKGPSLNPADKRLAVRTEEHPLDYGSFEGVIPQGQYGGGTVMLWDGGTWQPKEDPHRGLKKGHLSFVLQGRRLKGGWDLIRIGGGGKRENWLLIKENDNEANRTDTEFLDEQSFSVATGRSMDEIAGSTHVPKNAASSHRNKSSKSLRPGALPKLVQRYSEVQLATLVDEPPQGNRWLHEIKFDGYRLLGFISAGAVILRTRNGQDWTAKFPSIGAGLESLSVSDAVLDMEAVVIDDQGKSSFQALQAALGEGGNAKSVVAYVFDVLYLDGKDVTESPLQERKELLQRLLNKTKKAGPIRYSDHVEGHGREMLAKACGSGLEGIVSKQADAPYTAGRQTSWLEDKVLSEPGVRHSRLLRFAEGRTIPRSSLSGISSWGAHAVRR